MPGAQITGSVALVTGASSGIGRALARELASRGAVVALAARRGELLEGLADEIERTGARRPGVFVADLSQQGAAADLAGRVAGELGPVDVLLNNAGVSVHGNQCALGDRDEAREMFEVDFWSPLALVSALAPSMRDRGGGSVLNVTSMIQVSPFPSLGHTCAVKAALAITTQVLRIELHGTGVNVIEAILGPVDTPGSAETRLLRGGDKWLDGSGLGTADGAARAMVRAIERGDETVIYPRRLAPIYSLPGLGRRFAKGFSSVADADDDTVRLGGSAGDPANRAQRESWEAGRS